MKRLVPSALFVAFLLAACGPINSVEGHTLSLAFKAGNTYKYSFHLSTRQTVGMGALTVPFSVDIAAGETVTVKSVDSAGTADLSVKLTNLSIKTTMQDGTTNTTTVPAETTEIKIAADGHPVSWSGGQVTDNNPFLAFSALGGSYFVSAVLPSGKVKAKDTWTKHYDQTSPDGSGSLHISSTSTYLRDESLSGVGAAVVETKSNGTFNANIDMSKMAGGQTPPTASPLGGVALSNLTLKGTLTTDVTSWIDPNGHRVVQTRSSESDDGSMSMQLATPSPATGFPVAGLTGPFTIKGTATTALNPA